MGKVRVQVDCIQGLSYKLTLDNTSKEEFLQIRRDLSDIGSYVSYRIDDLVINPKHLIGVILNFVPDDDEEDMDAE